MRQRNRRFGGEHGFGPPGRGPFWVDAPFGPEFMGGRRGRRRRGDVRAGLLMLLAEEPRNGYQLMQAIEERSGGRWRPSPGAVYPSLAQLEDEGLIRAIDRDGTRLFEITDAGREHLEQRHEQTPPWEGDDESAAQTDLRGQIRQLMIAFGQVAHAGSEEQVKRAVETLSDARRKLYLILAEAETEEDGGEGLT